MVMRGFNVLKIERHSLRRIFIRRVVISALVLLLSAPGLTLYQASAKGAVAHAGTAPLRLKEAVSCLVAAGYIRKYGLPYVGLKVGEWAWVRYSVGSIPGIGDTPGVFNVVLYSRDRNRGILLFADLGDKDSFLAVYNGYHLYRHGSSWSADYGNGGFHLYEAVGKFVTTLSRSSPLYRILLTPGGRRCSTESL